MISGPKRALKLARVGASSYPRKVTRGGSKTGWLVACAAVAACLVATPAYAGSYGKVDALTVRKKIKKDLPKIHRCYESALRYEPELAGKVSVRFAVVRKGFVRGVHVIENTLGSEHVERCVTRVVSAIRFPSRRSGKSLRFTFPFVFAPQDVR